MREQLWRYDPTKDSWEVIDVKSPGGSPALCVLGDDLFFVGGMYTWEFENAEKACAARIDVDKKTVTLVNAKTEEQAVPEYGTGKTMVSALTGRIELNHVTFRYEEDGPAVLDDLSLAIEPGEYVGIVGRSGCGKSTLVKILLGFSVPQEGTVCYDDYNINVTNLRSLRRCIGTVLQDGKLFSGDIYSNITITAPHLGIEEAWDAAERVGMAEDIRRLPMGMRTVITEGSGGMSGGQIQRLMITRAIVNKPKILIMDEATSALDNLTQKTVTDSLDALDCTRIVIAHRLSTIRSCDRIIALDKGKIVESGNYDELMEKDGFFAGLVKRQQVNEN